MPPRKKRQLKVDQDEPGAPPLVLRDLSVDPNPGTGRAPTSGTRHGNGKGFWGPARGKAPPRQPPPAPAESVPRDRHWRAYNSIRAAAREDVLMEHLWDMAYEEEKGADRINATVAALNRIGGLPVQRVIQAEAGASYFIEGRAESPSIEEWTQKAQLAIAKPAGNGDD